MILAWLVGDRQAAWRLGEVGRAHLRADRRDRTWVRLRKAELQEAEFADPDHGGLPLDDDERRELQAVTEALEPDELEGLEFAPSTRAATIAFLAKDPTDAGLGHGALGHRRPRRHRRPARGDPRPSGARGQLRPGRARQHHRSALPRAARPPRRGRRRHGARRGEPAPGPPERSNAAFQYFGAESLIALRPRRPARLHDSGALGRPRRQPGHPLGHLRRRGRQRLRRRRRRPAWTRRSPTSSRPWSAIELAPGNAPNYGLIACWPCTPCGSSIAPTTSTPSRPTSAPS